MYIVHIYLHVHETVIVHLKMVRTINMMAGIGVLNLVCMQLSTSGIVPSLAATRATLGKAYIVLRDDPNVAIDTSRDTTISPALPSNASPNV